MADTMAMSAEQRGSRSEVETEQAWSYDDLRTTCTSLRSAVYLFVETEGYGPTRNAAQELLSNVAQSRGTLSGADHNRMHYWTQLYPAILEAETYNRWLAGNRLFDAIKTLSRFSVFLLTGWMGAVTDEQVFKEITAANRCNEMLLALGHEGSVGEAPETDRDGSQGSAGRSIAQDVLVDQGSSYGGIEINGELPIYGNLSFTSNQTCQISWIRGQNENGEEGIYRNECRTTVRKWAYKPPDGYFDKAKLEDALATVRRHQNVAFDEEREAWQDHLNAITRVPASRDEVLITGSFTATRVGCDGLYDRYGSGCGDAAEPSR